MDRASALLAVRPLIKRGKSTGQVYERVPEVEAQIAELLAHGDSELLGRVRLQDSRNSEYVRDETLVYFIRASHFQGNKLLTSDLSEALLTRCNPFIASKLYNLGIDAREEATGSVIEMLFDRILDSVDGRGDFAEVRFQLFLKRIVTDMFKQYIAVAKKEQYNISPEWVYGSELGGDIQPGSDYSAPMAASGLSPDHRLLVEEALRSLEEPYRTLVILRYYEGWPVESNDPHEPTISTYFGKTSRTIRLWLAKAEQQLSKWREGEL